MLREKKSCSSSFVLLLLLWCIDFLCTAVLLYSSFEDKKNKIKLLTPFCWLNKTFVRVLVSMIRSKFNSGKSSNSDTLVSQYSNEIPITEEELKAKQTSITINDVFRLTKPTNSKTYSYTKQPNTILFSRLFNPNR